MRGKKTIRTSPAMARLKTLPVHALALFRRLAQTALWSAVERCVLAVERRGWLQDDRMEGHKRRCRTPPTMQVVAALYRTSH